MSCNFDDSETEQSLTEQIKAYFLGRGDFFVSTDTNKVNVILTQEQYDDLVVCDDLDLVTDRYHIKHFIYNDTIDVLIYIITK